MTDAKQALEVAEDLRIGLAEMAASCSVNMETWDRFSNNVLDAASLLSSLAEEIERLRGELRRAHLKRLVELSEEFGGYDELSTSALSALKTAREGNNA